MSWLTNPSFSVPTAPKYGRPRALVRQALITGALALASCSEPSTQSLVTLDAGTPLAGCTDPKTCGDPSPKDGCTDPKTCGDPSPKDGCTNPKTCGDPSPKDGCADPKTCGDPLPLDPGCSDPKTCGDPRPSLRPSH